MPAALRSDVPVRSPAEYRLEYWVDGTWVEVPDQQRHLARPEGRRANTVSFPPRRTAALRVVWARHRVEIEPVTTSRVRAVFEHARPAATAVAKIIIRGR